MGKIFKFHTDVDTDQIIASQYLLFPTIDEMKTHTFESLDPTFAERGQPGDYVVAAENFGFQGAGAQRLKSTGGQSSCGKIFCPYLLPQCHQYRSSGHRL